MTALNTNEFAVIFSASLTVHRAKSLLVNKLSPIPSVDLCLSVGWSVRKVYCGKTADWVPMPFEWDRLRDGCIRWGGLLSVAGDLLWLISTLKLKSLQCTFTHYEDMKGNAKCGIWGGLGRGHPRSPSMSPFNRALTTSYSTLIKKTMSLSATVLEFQQVIVESRRF